MNCSSCSYLGRQLDGLNYTLSQKNEIILHLNEQLMQTRGEIDSIHHDQMTKKEEEIQRLEQDVSNLVEKTQRLNEDKEILKNHMVKLSQECSSYLKINQELQSKVNHLVIAKPYEDPNFVNQNGSEDSNCLKVQQQQQLQDKGLPSDASFIINLLSYEKRDEGTQGYLVYKIASHVINVPGYTRSSYEILRHFNDFLSLREKLVKKYQHTGIIVPTAPEKGISALTKTKLNSAYEENTSNEVVDKRARDLQRFLRRIARHPQLAADCDFRDFITMDGDLPTEFSIDENGRWYEQVYSQVDELEERQEDIKEALLQLIESLVECEKQSLEHSDKFQREV